MHARCSGCSKAVAAVFTVLAWDDGRLDASCEGVNEQGELGDCFECAGLALPGDVGDRLSGGIQSDRTEHDQSRRVNDDLGSRPAILGIPDAKPVDRLVNQDAQLRVS